MLLFKQRGKVFEVLRKGTKNPYRIFSCTTQYLRCIRGAQRFYIYCVVVKTRAAVGHSDLLFCLISPMYSTVKWDAVNFFFYLNGFCRVTYYDTKEKIVTIFVGIISRRMRLEHLQPSTLLSKKQKNNIYNIFV